MNPSQKYHEVAFSAIFSDPQGLARELCFMHCDRAVTQRAEKIAKTLWDMANFRESIVASDSE